jgi:hypothetical protein
MRLSVFGEDGKKSFFGQMSWSCDEGNGNGWWGRHGGVKTPPLITSKLQADDSKSTPVTPGQVLPDFVKENIKGFMMESMQNVTHKALKLGLSNS